MSEMPKLQSSGDAYIDLVKTLWIKKRWSPSFDEIMKVVVRAVAIENEACAQIADELTGPCSCPCVFIPSTIRDRVKDHG